MKRLLKTNQGQLLLEVLFAIAVSAAVLGVGASILIGGLNAAKVATERDAALQLVDETFEAVRAVAFEDWNEVYDKQKGSNDKYFPELDFVSVIDDVDKNYEWVDHDGTGNWGSSSVNVVSALSPRSVWIGVSNDIYQYDGVAWTNRNPTSTFIVNDIATVSDEEIWAVGQGGNVWVYTGSSWIQHSGTGLWEATDINGVSASNSSNVWIVGDSGLVYKYDGSTWTSHSGGWNATNLNATSALDDNVYIAGNSGEVWQYDDSSWVDRSPSGWGSVNINDVSFHSAGDPINVWIAGDSGNVGQYDGSWTTHSTGLRWGSSNVTSVSAYDTDHVFISAGQELWTFTGGITWTEFPNEWGVTLLDISDRFSTELWAVGSGGEVRGFKPAKWMLTAVSGQNNEITLNGIIYDVEVSIENVFRDGSGNIASSGTEDEGTQKITATVSWSGGSVSSEEYISRWTNDSCLQTQWSNGLDSDVHLICPTTDYDEETDMNFVSNGESLAISSPLLNGTATLTSTVFDTVRSSTPTESPIFRFIRWNGNMEDNEDEVKFQIAASDCPDGESDYPTCSSGSWTYYGDDCQATSGGWFTWTSTEGAITDEQAEIDCPVLNEKRYFRYRIELVRGELILSVSGTTPRVDDVNIIWTP